MSSAWLSLTAIAVMGWAVSFFLSRYDALARSQKRVKEAWSGIEVQLRRRASLLPNVVETVRGYAEHEREVFAWVARARAAMQTADGAGQTATASNLLTLALDRLFAVVENYPQLRESANFLTLCEALRDAEKKMAFACQLYNHNVLDFNSRLDMYPEGLVARQFGFTPAEFFQ